MRLLGNYIKIFIEVLNCVKALFAYGFGLYVWRMLIDELTIKGGLIRQRLPWACSLSFGVLFDRYALRCYIAKVLLVKRKINILQNSFLC